MVRSGSMRAPERGGQARLQHVELLATLGSTSGGTLHRGRLGDGTRVLVKRVAPGTQSRLASPGLARERELLDLLADADLGPRPLGLLDSPAEPALVLEDRPGELLETYLSSHRPSQAQCIAIAADLARALAEVHAARLVQRDLRPLNVLLHAAEGQPRPRAYLVDLSRAAPEGPATPLERGQDLAYLSPERSGRVGREVDGRSDLYALGVLLYRMLTARLPFTASDLLEWVHCHVARQPRPPSDLCSLSPGVSDLVMKLLAKLPDERYQSAQGLALDLEECLRWPQGDGRPLLLGSQDVSPRFRLPGRLYGREAELESLLSVFRRTIASGAPSAVMVTGSSGIGKSSLVGELRRPLTEARAQLGWAKFDREQGGSPYATLGRALDRLVQPILAGSEAEAGRWRTVLLDALSGQGQLIVDLVPHLGRFLGPQAAVPALPGADAQRRFERVLQRFLAALSSANHPVVLFLDDLQWANPETLALLRHLVSHPDTHHLLLLGAYRDNEVAPAHPLLAAIEGIREAGRAVETVALGPFSPEDATRLVADTLRCDLCRCEPLSRLVHERTEGNPFFFVHFLSSLHDEGLIAFHRPRREWTWDLDRIRGREFAESAAELMINKFRQLPAPTRQLVRLAACLGTGFELDTLALVSGEPLEQTEQDLSEAIERGFLRPAPDGGLRFAHDRAQEAAYELVAVEERPRLHVHIGRLLAARAGPAGASDRVFEVVGHLERGETLLDGAERLRLAHLELEAGRRAQASMAHHAAARYFAQGQAHLPTGAWQDHHALSHALALGRARAGWLSGDFACAEESISLMLREARTRCERTEAYRVWIDLLTTRNQVEECVRTALDACAQLFGLRLPLHPSPEDLQRGFGAALAALEGREIEQLLELPEMSDPELQGLLALVSSALPTIFFVDQKLHDLLVSEIVRLSVRHGNSAHSSHAYVCFGLSLGFDLDRWGEAFRFSQLACALADRYDSGSKVGTFYLAGVLTHHVRPPAEAIAMERAAWQAAVAGGDANHGCYASAWLVHYRLTAGEPLEEVAEEARRQLEFTRSVKYRQVHDTILVLARFVESLRGGTRRLGSFDGPGFDSQAFASEMTAEFPYLPEAYHGYRAAAELLAGDFAGSLASSARARPHLRRGPISLDENHPFFTAVAASARLDEAPEEERRALRETLLRCRDEVRALALRSPQLFDGQLALLEAEVARVEGRDADALRAYDRAIGSARGGGFVHLEGISGEVAARFHAQRGSFTAATAHLRAARDAYRRWGAHAKVAALEAEHPELRPDRTPRTAGDEVVHLDLLAAARASQAISGEIRAERLLETLLRTVVESAGARAGWLLLEGGKESSLAARATVNGPDIDVQVFVARAPTSELPPSILSYVRRSHEALVIDDAFEPSPFSSDPELRRRGARSVVCLPIVRQGAVTALVYLENDVAPSAFTPERLALLEVLAAQAAISLELSRHREQLEGVVAQRTEELTRANELLRCTNRRLEQAHKQLLYSEKMASIGQLAAGVAHEINNPVSYVASNLGTLEDHFRALVGALEARAGPGVEDGVDLEQTCQEVVELLADCRHGLHRVKDVVLALRTLSHRGEGGWRKADLRLELKSAIALLRGEIHRKADLAVEYGETPEVECLPSELNRVFVNVLLNATQAITGRGTISLRTGSVQDEVWVEVSDNGRGIAPEDLGRIFDPFFTTKPVGEGTGLGLSLAYSIVEKHHGRIEVESEPGQGTRFRIWLPVRQSPGDPAP